MTENPECSYWNSDSEAVESRMRDCFGFPYFIWGASNVSLQTHLIAGHLTIRIALLQRGHLDLLTSVWSHLGT